MTKNIRIENADTSDYKVVVEVWDECADPMEIDRLIEKKLVRSPTDLCDVCLHSTRYLVVREYDKARDEDLV